MNLKLDSFEKRKNEFSVFYTEKRRFIFIYRKKRTENVPPSIQKSPCH